MATNLKNIAIIFVAGLCILVIDTFLLREEIDTTVARVEKGGRQLVYNIPESGGDEGSCSVGEDKSQVLTSGAEVIVERTLLRGRCVSVKPIHCEGVVCSSGRDNKIDSEALLKQSLRIAYRGKYENFVSLAADHPGYSPQIRRWPIVRGPLSSELYSVRLPDQLVIFDRDANFRTTRECGSVEGFCQKIKQVLVERKL